MKLLLDENLPVKLRHSFSNQHQVLTVRECGWSGTKNGELLKLMISEGFDALVTIDKNLVLQQNLKEVSLLIFILNAPNNKIQTLKPFIDQLELAISSQAFEKNIVVVNII